MKRTQCAQKGTVSLTKAPAGLADDPDKCIFIEDQLKQPDPSDICRVLARIELNDPGYCLLDGQQGGIHQVGIRETLERRDWP